MKSAIATHITTACTLALCLSANLYSAEIEAGAQVSEEGALVMTTSKPKVQPLLMTLQTAQVLESYGLGFSGSGNIHRSIKNWEDSPLRGSIILGLGDVAEIGYGMEEFHTVSQETQKLMRGHIKLQLFKDENGTIPSFALAYNQNLQDKFEDFTGASYKLERKQFEALGTWSYGNQNRNLSVHPGLVLVQDEIVEYLGAPQKKRTAAYFNPQLGLTWQTQEKVTYMFETRYHRYLKDDTLGLSAKPSFEGAIDANLGIRYFFRNWLFADAGVRYTWLTEQKEGDSEIHANFTGVIPLRSIFSRTKHLSN